MILLFGAGGHGGVVLETLMRLGEKNIIFSDDAPKLFFQGIPVLQAGQLNETDIHEAIVTIGNNHHRKNVAHRLPYKFRTAVHDYAFVSEKIVGIGCGTVIMAGAIVNPHVKIGKHVIINTGAIIDHECKIADFAHISPRATLCGDIEVGEGAHIGAGAIVIPGINVGNWATLGAGAVLIEDLPDYCTAVGNPAKIIKFGDEKKNA